MSLAPFFKQPYLLVTSATSKCLTKLLAFLNDYNLKLKKILLIKISWELDFTFEDLLIDSHWVIVIEWVNASVHLISQDSESPPIDWFTVTLVQEHFWSQVFWGSAKGIGSSLAVFSKTKVRQFQISFLIDQDVFRFQVSVDDIFGVEIFKHEANLGGIESKYKIRIYLYDYCECSDDSFPSVLK